MGRVDEHVERRVHGLAVNGALGVGRRRECQASEQMTTLVRPKICVRHIHLNSDRENGTSETRTIALTLTRIHLKSS